MNKDILFSNGTQYPVDFVFSEAVADVFPDMIRRSVPGYETVLTLLGVIARLYIKPSSRVYDLGASLGAATLAVQQQLRVDDVEFICVDNSEAMTTRCGQALDRHIPEANVSVICDDIQNIRLENASLVMLNFTLQFIPIEQRLQLIQSIYDALKPGGALVLSEKLQFSSEAENQLQIALHHEFKRANGYSELEISRKRTALENVLIPNTEDEHVHRLNQVGFKEVHRWFQGFNFASFLAVKA